jgi:hypothetical protein
MKLNAQHRKDFVDAVLKDLPRPAAAARAKAIADLAKTYADALPDEVKKVKALYPEALAFRSEYLKEFRIPYDYRAIAEDEGLRTETYISVVSIGRLLPITVDDSTQAPFLAELTCLLDYKTRLNEMASACQTLDQLKELLPELVKYMPEPAPKVSKALPMVVAGGLVEELCKSGLPACKGKKRARA